MQLLLLIEFREKTSSLTSNPNINHAILDATSDKVNLTYISKFGLPSSVIQYINFDLIFNKIHINNFTIVSDIKLNLWVLNWLESYQLSTSLVMHIILEVFCDKFYR